MRLGLIAKKIGMSRFYDSAGTNQCVTILKVSDCKIVNIRNKEKHGYNAYSLSFGLKNKDQNKPMKGFLKKNNLKSFYALKEFRVDKINGLKLGDSVDVDNFQEGQFVDISGNTIGKGFAGGMKRHNFSGNRATHGVSISHRSHGSTGQCQDPGKVFKGKKMAGRLGNVKRTIQNLLVLKVDKSNGTILIKGSVPGPKGALLNIFDSIKGKNPIDLTKVVKPETQNEGKKNKENEKKSEVNVKADEVKDDKKDELNKNSDEKKVNGDEGKN